MISDNFYPEAYSLNNSEISLTADVLTLSDSIAENMAPYYIGYVSFENMPTHWKFNTAEIVSDNTVNVSAITQNYGWGFLYHWNDVDGSGISLMRPCLIADVGGTKTDLSGQNYSHHFVNHGIIASANFANRFRLFFCYIAMPTAWLTEDDSCIYSKWAGHYCEALTQNVYLSYEQIVDFLDNNGTITLTNLQYDTRNNSVTLHASDFGADNHTAKMVSSETPAYTVFIQLVNVVAMGQQAYVQNNNTVSNSRFTPFFAMDVKGNGSTIADQKTLVCPNDLCNSSGHYLNITFDGVQSDQQKMTALSYSSADHSVVGSSYMGNLKILNGLTQQDFRERGYSERTYYWYADGGIIRGSFIVGGGNTLTCSVAVPMELEDMRRIACFLMNKIETNVTGSAAISDFTDANRGYTTDFSTALFDKSTSNPLDGGTRVYENFVDIADRLCLWQYPYTDMTVNKFTEDLIPEWTPPGPEPSDWGDDRYGTVPGLWLSSDGITANFITPWVLKGSQVSNFGQFLWENLFLPDPDDPSIINGLWQNFLDALGTYWQTGSFDPASTLDFVVSLLYYPFDLSSNSADTNTKKLYFGTGVAGLTVSAAYNTRKLSTYHGWIYGGGLDLNDAAVKSALAIPDDFRGLANTSACIYLPFCGTYQVNWADIRDSGLSIYYAIDFTTGACTAYVISSKSGCDTYVLNASGVIGFSVPLSATNANRLVASILGDVSDTGSKFIETGQNAAAKIITGSNAETPSQIMGNGSDDGADLMTMRIAGGPIAGSAMSGITAGGRVANDLFSRPSIGIPSMSGGSGWNALHCPRTPYIQVRTPQYIPDPGHGHAYGWPAEKQASSIENLPLPDASNYYECINVDTSSLTCTHDERQMIKRYLENGFYILK